MLDRLRLERVQDQPQIERHALQHRARHLGTAVRHGQAHESAARMRIPIGTALAQEIGEEEQAVGSGRDGRRGHAQRVVEVAFSFATQQTLQPIERAPGCLHRAQRHDKLRVQVRQVEGAHLWVKERPPRRDGQPG